MGWKGRGKKKSNFTAEKSDKHDLSQVVKVNINSDKSGWVRGLRIWCDERGALPIILPKTFNPSLTRRKTSDKPKFYKIPDKESLKNLHSQEEPKETWLLDVMSGPGWDPGTEKGH